MKNELFMMLQMFAEEPAPAEPTTQDPQNNSPETDPKPEPEKKYTDEDVNKIIDRKFAEWEKKQSKAKSEAERLANMNAEQKEKYENEQLKKQVEELLRKDALSKMSAVARGMLSEKSISVSDELVDMMISDDAEKTKSSVESFITAFEDAVGKAVKEALKGSVPKKTETSSITKEQILKVKNPLERQKLIQENMDLFKKGN